MAGAGFSKYAIRQASDTQEAPNWDELLDDVLHKRNNPHDAADAVLSATIRLP